MPPDLVQPVALPSSKSSENSVAACAAEVKARMTVATRPVMVTVRRSRPGCPRATGIVPLLTTKPPCGDGRPPAGRGGRLAGGGDRGRVAVKLFPGYW